MRHRSQDRALGRNRGADTRRGAYIEGRARTGSRVNCGRNILLVHFLYNFEVDCQYHFHTRRVVKQVLYFLSLSLIAFAVSPPGNAADATKLPGGTWAS